jgi:uncharacterized membrane protein
MTEKKPQDVRQLANLVKETLPLTEKRILEAVLKLQSEGKIRLENQPLQFSLKPAIYIKTGRVVWYWVTAAVAVLTAAVVFLVPEAFYPWAYIRNALGAIFVLCLPGYAFIRALFPAREPTKSIEENLDTLERIALSLVMSIVLVMIIGLLLNYTPWGVRLTPIVLSLLIFTFVFATVAVVREYQLAK